MPGTPRVKEFGRMVGRRLEYARAERKLGINELARMANVAPSQVSGVLGERQLVPSFFVVCHIAEALGVRLDWLVTGKGDPWIAPHNNPQPPPAKSSSRVLRLTAAR